MDYALNNFKLHEKEHHMLNKFQKMLIYFIEMEAEVERRSGCDGNINGSLGDVKFKNNEFASFAVHYKDNFYDSGDEDNDLFLEE